MLAGPDRGFVEKSAHLGSVAGFKIDTRQCRLKTHLDASSLCVSPGPAAVVGEQHRFAHLFSEQCRVKLEDDASAHYTRLRAVRIEGKVPGQLLLAVLLNLRRQVEVQVFVLAFQGVTVGGVCLEPGRKIQPLPVASPEGECRCQDGAATACQHRQAAALIHARDPVRRPAPERPDGNAQERDEQQRCAAKQAGHWHYRS
ncbi:hypothetical protein D3C84_502040 [compost metagenome]